MSTNPDIGPRRAPSLVTADEARLAQRIALEVYRLRWFGRLQLQAELGGIGRGKYERFRADGTIPEPGIRMGRRIAWTGDQVVDIKRRISEQAT